MAGDDKKRDVAGDGAGLRRSARESEGLARLLSRESSNRLRSSELSDAFSMRLEPAISSQEPDRCERFATAGERRGVARASGIATGNVGRRIGSADTAGSDTSERCARRQVSNTGPAATGAAYGQRLSI